jgi:hypothetical protein
MFFNFRVGSQQNSQTNNIQVYLPPDVVTHLKRNITDLAKTQHEQDQHNDHEKRKRDENDEDEEESDKKKNGQQYTPFFEPTPMMEPESTIQDSLARKLLDDILSLSYGGNYKALFCSIRSTLVLDDSLIHNFLKHDSMAILDGIVEKHVLTPLESLIMLRIINICLQYPEGNKDLSKCEKLLNWIVGRVNGTDPCLQKEALLSLITFCSSFQNGVDRICSGFAKMSKNRFARLTEVLGDETCLDYELKTKILEFIDVMFTEAYESEEKLESVQKDFFILKLGEILRDIAAKVDDDFDQEVQTFYESWGKFKQ